MMLPGLPMVEPWCEAAGDYEQKLPTGAVMQGPPEGAVDHGLEKANLQKAGNLHWSLAGFSPGRGDIFFCNLYCFGLVLKNLL